jgi:hypothetical protein
MLCYVTVDNCFYGYTGATWLAHDLVSQSYTPGLFQPGAITCTVTSATYQRRFYTCYVQVNLAITGTGTANNPIIIAPPVTAVRSGQYGGSGIIYDSSAGNIYPSLCVLTSTANIRLVDTTNPALSVTLYQGMTGSAFALGLGSGDVLSFTYEYDVA